MNKKMSRIAAIALSAAMVTSAFAMSTSASFASTLPAENKVATVAFKDAYKTIVKDNTAVDFGAPATTTLDLADAQVNGKTVDLSAFTPTLKSVTNSNGSVLKYRLANDTTPTFTPESIGASTVTFNYVISDTTDNIDYSFTVTGTVKVANKDTTKFITADAAATTSGADFSGVYSSATAPTNFTIKSLDANNATYETTSTGTAYALPSSSATVAWTSSNTNAVTLGSSAGVTVAPGFANAGTSTISAAITNGNNSVSVTPLTVTVKENTAIVTTASSITIAPSATNSAITQLTNGSNVIDVTGKDITLSGTTMTSLNVAAGSKVGSITLSGATALTAINIAGATVGDITTATSTSADELPSATLSIADGATVGAVDLSNASAVTPTITNASGKGALTVKSVTLPSTDTNGVAITNSSTSAVTVSAIKAAKATFTGVATSGSMTAPTTTFNVTSLLPVSATNGVDVSVTDANLNVTTAGKLKTVTTNATVTTVSEKVAVGNHVNVGGAITSTNGADTFSFAKGANIEAAVAGVTGKNVVVEAPVNTLTFGAAPSVGDVAVKLLGSYKAGDTWATVPATTDVDLGSTPATTGVIIPADFRSASASDAIETENGYSFLISGTTVTGITLDKTTATLANGGTLILTASNLPAGAADYSNYDVHWTTSNPDFVTVSGSGKTATIKAVKYTDAPVASTDNSSVITATYNVYDSSNQLAGSFTATCKVTVSPAPALTTTVTDLNGKTQTVDENTVIQMTQSTYNTVKFASNGTISNIAYSTGNDKVAQTGTVSAWNGTAGEYTIYANGKVGDKVGVYANGKKVFQVEIVDRPFTSDTTVDFAMKAGSKYQFKIIPNADTTIKDFTFNTANDAALSTWGFTKNADGTVTATVKANKAGKYGVYCDINGVKYKVFAVTVK
ncbi:beta strand repeat-containing protein [Caproicibacterium sp. XB1]|uniref:beta strand repeat-containing protein n=1 Tax=Caproicibacterium sp. XB1 TaxID=3396405 RepID=UPI0039B6F3BA